MTAVHLADLRWPDVPPGAVLVVPLGSCEQHGPHLPIGTDSAVATALADALGAQRPEVVVAPVLAFGASWEHAGFPGLVSITADLLAAVLVEMARSAEWAVGLVFVSGHGGNAHGVNAAVRTIRADGRRVMAWAPREDGGDAHAGFTETSVMLALEPGAVAAEHAAPGWCGPLTEVWDRGVAAVSPNGVLGDPAEASAAHGHALLARWTADLLAAYGRWHSAGSELGGVATPAAPMP